MNTKPVDKNTEKALNLERPIWDALKVPKPIGTGLVNKIIDRKGKRSLNETTGLYEYHLKTELVELFPGQVYNYYTKGLYWVMDLFHNEEGKLQWNHYLVIVESKDKIYPVAEFVDVHDSTWIKDAMPTIKDYFEEKRLKSINLTKCKTLQRRQVLVKR